jgi:hypothetical protein
LELAPCQITPVVGVGEVVVVCADVLAVVTVGAVCGAVTVCVEDEVCIVCVES